MVHAGGAATGAEIERALVTAVHRTAAALHENTFALDLIEEDGRCVGVTALDPSGTRREIRATHVLLATGGAGQVFAVTTNPLEATGDGVAMALRAGVAVADVEFVQFHPTALHHPRMPRPLLSEALRGHGALIRNAKGERFVDELLPRDEVSRAMTRCMLEEGTDHCWLDATGLENFERTVSDDQRRAAAPPISIPPRTGCRSLPPRTTCAVGWSPISMAPATYRVCGPRVRSPARECTELIVWRPTPCSRAWCSRSARSKAIERGKGEAEPTGAMRSVHSR